MPEDLDAREAPHGQKMIEVKVRFWTNDIADRGKIIPKHAWGSGEIRMESNPAHEISPLDTIPFNSLAEIPSIIEQALDARGIKIHPSAKMRRYLAT